MRKSVILPVVLHTLVGTAAFVWLLWYFIPVGNVVKGLLTLLILILAGVFIRKNSHHRETQTHGPAFMDELSLTDTQGPVVLVCGDRLNVLFQGQSLRKTSQGWWQRAGDIDQLADVVRDIQTRFPRQTGQLSVMYVCRPGRHPDEGVLRAGVKTLRQQIRQIHAITGFSLPLVMCCEFPGPETPWAIVRGDKPVVYPTEGSPLALTNWQQTDDNILLLPLLSQAFDFVRKTLLDELEKADRLTPAVHPFAVTLRLGAENPALPSVWSGWLFHLTGLQFPLLPERSAPVSRFPDAVLPLLAPFASPVQGGQRTRRVILLIWLCALTALSFSALNNRDLIRQVGADLQRWSAIPMNHFSPKAASLAALKQDALLLERWQRQGEPLRYSLGYYPGQRLWLAVQQTIDTYVPPPTPLQKSAPKIVRLDSMSLFDSGKAELKDGSTRVLVNALVGIKARPGWLIVVSGHTDNTGNAPLNQTLSLQRAEAVRNWMRDTGDVPESCFAVQGYGDSRPVASNDTPDGRAHNRRVEISLVPQANACRVPDATTALPEASDVLNQHREK